METPSESPEQRTEWNVRDSADLVMARGKLMRHIPRHQKTEESGCRACAWGKVERLCDLFIQITSALEMGPFYWFGGAPGHPLPSITALSEADADDTEQSW
jgi:hypothetical protein